MEMADINWWHSIDLGDGIITPGKGQYGDLKATADLVFRFPLGGKTVLDIGAWDGFYSFEAEHRGASRVLATDYIEWDRDGGKDGFDYAKKKLKSKVEERKIDLYGLSVDTVGQFDVVLFLGVLYHLKDFMVQLERLLPLARELFIIETLTAANDLNRPIVQYIPGSSLNSDNTNYFAPNLLALRCILEDLGYNNIEQSIVPMTPDYHRVVTTVYTCPIYRIITL